MALESRNSYGYGMVGSDEKGYEWLIVYGERKPHQKYKSGYVYKTEKKAIEAGKKFQRECKNEELRNGELSAVKAEPLHFEY